MIPVLRGFLFGFGALLLMVVPAQAATEFCAATVSTFIPIHNTAVSKTDLGTDTEFGFKLRAETARTIDATLAVYAGGDLYELRLHRIALSVHTETEKLDPGNSDASLVRTVFESTPMYFRFAKAMTADAAWISEAGVDGAPKSCPTMPYAGIADQSRAATISDVPPATVRAMAATDAPRIRLEAHVDAGACATKFVPAKGQLLVAPDFPEVARGNNHMIAIATVALDSAGKVADAWIVGSSGSPEVDAATLRAAKASTYLPAEFLCVPISGLFTFRANFAPSH
jgi:TonB family protein